MDESNFVGLEAECPCVGSMGLHQNNLLSSQTEDLGVDNFSTLGLTFNGMKNRSVIDVFRDIRDKYFGKPSIPKEATIKISQVEHLDGEETAEDTGSCSATLESLPVYCKLMILSLLDTRDVCSISLLNSQWREVANDQILWRELLIRDMCKWDSMSNRSHPLISQVWDNDSLGGSSKVINFFELLQENNTINKPTSSNVTSQNSLANHRKKGINFKALYIHTSFQRTQDDVDSPQSNLSIPGFIMSLWQGADTQGQGEIIITGPGIDSPRTSSIFKSLMWGNGFLETKGLLPGNRDGIGSGVQVVFKDKTPFNLIALYSGNNRVRENRFGMERLLRSNVVELMQNEGGNEDDNTSPREFMLHDAVRFYIAERRGLYKLIYVVDATADQEWEHVSCNKLELSAILKGTEYDHDISAALQPLPEEQNANARHGVDADRDVINPPVDISPTITGKRPLLVLSCVKDISVDRFSCMQITAMLGLPSINDRHWRVQDVVVSTMDGVEKGLDWLLRQP